ncbi:MAG: SDR family NAD(P)-dependent oxidoreductase [Mycobacterium sp.]
MPASPTASVLITGANSGIGKEVARQFAESGSFDAVYLACRNPAKAEAARAELERTTGRSIFTTVPLDTSDLGSVRAAIGLIDTSSTGHSSREARSTNLARTDKSNTWARCGCPSSRVEIRSCGSSLSARATPRAPTYSETWGQWRRP